MAVIADSDPGAVYEQHRWLGAVVAAGAVCAFVAMMGWATLRHGGVPAPVLLMALTVAGAPFVLPGGLFLPGAAAAVGVCGALAAVGLGRPPASPQRARRLSAGLAASALVLAVGQAVLVGLHGVARAERKLAPTPLAAAAPAHRAPARAAARAHRAPAPAAAPARRAPTPATARARPAPASPRHFIRAYYAALDARRFTAAWRMLSPGVRAGFGGFAAWRRGYARTLSSEPGAVRVIQAAGGATVGLTLRAGDRDGCGNTVARRFAVTWRLARAEAGWRATAATARKLAGPEPARDC